MTNEGLTPSPPIPSSEIPRDSPLPSLRFVGRTTLDGATQRLQLCLALGSIAPSDPITGLLNRPISQGRWSCPGPRPPQARPKPILRAAKVLDFHRHVTKSSLTPFRPRPLSVPAIFNFDPKKGTGVFFVTPKVKATPESETDSRRLLSPPLLSPVPVYHPKHDGPIEV